MFQNKKVPKTNCLDFFICKNISHFSVLKLSVFLSSKNKIKTFYSTKNICIFYAAQKIFENFGSRK